MSDRIHVCYCINRKMLTPLCVSAFSAAKSVGGENITIWIFHEDLAPHDMRCIQDVLAPYDGVDLNIQKIDVREFEGWRGLHGEVITFAKPLLPYLLREETDRLVYLDADTVVAGGLDDLYHHDLHGHTVGAVSYGNFGESQNKSFFDSKGFDLRDREFNAGVMVIDIEDWVKRDITNKIISFMKRNNTEYDGADQAAQNAVLYKRFLPLRIRYNKRASPGSGLERKHTMDGIIHFVGLPKPWDLGGRWLNKNYTLYVDYRRKARVCPRSFQSIIRANGLYRTLKGIYAGLQTVVS